MRRRGFMLVTIASMLTIGLYTGCGGSKSSSGGGSSSGSTNVKAIDGYIYNAKVVSTYRIFDKKTGKKVKDITVEINQSLARTVLMDKGEGYGDKNKTIPGGESYRTIATEAELAVPLAEAKFKPKTQDKALISYEIKTYKMSKRGTKKFYLPSFIDKNKNGKYDKGEDFVGSFKALVGSTIVTPLTNLLYNAFDVDSNDINLSNAKASILKKSRKVAENIGKRLGVTSNQLISLDPIAALPDPSTRAYSLVSGMIAMVNNKDDIKALAKSLSADISKEEEAKIPTVDEFDDKRFKKSLDLVKSIVQKSVTNDEKANNIRNTFQELAAKAENKDFFKEVLGINIDESRDDSKEVGSFIAVSNKQTIVSDLNISSIEVNGTDLSSFIGGDKIDKVLANFKAKFEYVLAGKKDYNKSLTLVFHVKLKARNNYNDKKDFNSSMSIALPVLVSKESIKYDKKGKVNIAMTDNKGKTKVKSFDANNSKNQIVSIDKDATFSTKKTVNIGEIIKATLATNVVKAVFGEDGKVVNVVDSSNFQSAVGKIQVLIVKDDKSKVSFVKNIGDKTVVISPSQISISHGTGFTYNGYSIIDMDKADFRGPKTAKNKGVKLSDAGIGKAGKSGIDGYLKGNLVPVPFRIFTANGVKYRLINLPQESNRTGIEYNISDINISTTIGESFEYYKVGFDKLPTGIIDLNSTLAKVKAKNQEWNLSLRPIGAIDFEGAALKIPLSALTFADDKNTTLSIAIKVFEEFGLDEVNKTALNFIFNRPPEALTSGFIVKKIKGLKFDKLIDGDTVTQNSNADINLTWNEDYKQFRVQLAKKEYNGSVSGNSEGNGTVIWVLTDKDNTKKGENIIKIKDLKSLVGNANKKINDVNGSVIKTVFVADKNASIDFNTSSTTSIGYVSLVRIRFETNGTFDANGKLPLRITFDGNATGLRGYQIVASEETNGTVNSNMKFPVRITFVDTEDAESSFDFNITLN